MRNPSVVLLVGKGESSQWVYNALRAEFPVAAVIMEESVPRLRILKRRVRTLGIWRALGQLLFRALVVPWLRRISAERKQRILAEEGLSSEPIPDQNIMRVETVNSDLCRELLTTFAPCVVVVNGTRIISRETLGTPETIFINTHVGITPKYRGVHGGYWALAQGDPENCGVTVHLVDPGIDTGQVLYQARIRVTGEDNFCTYPVLQYGAAVPLLKAAVRDAIANSLRPTTGPGPSRLWYHPTITSYAWCRFTRGVC